MTAILVVSDDDALWSNKGLRDPHVILTEVEDDGTGETNYATECSECDEDGLDGTAYRIEDLIEHAKLHLARHGVQ